MAAPGGAGRELALGVEFVAQVVERVVLAVRVGAERGPGCGDQVVEVGQSAGQAGGEGGRSRRTAAGSMSSALVSVPMAETAVVVAAGYLLKIGVRVVRCGWS